jgi:hypothetical protein
MRFNAAGFPGIVCADTLMAKIPDGTRNSSDLAAPESIAFSFSLIPPPEAKRKIIFLWLVPLALRKQSCAVGRRCGHRPEIIIKSLGHADPYDRCRPLVIGDAGRLDEAGCIVEMNRIYG